MQGSADIRARKTYRHFGLVVGLIAAALGTIAPNAARALTVLYSFSAHSENGFSPAGSLALNPRTGALFGTTLYGGGAGCVEGSGCGVAFELGLNAVKVPKVFERIHVFGVTNGDGIYAYAGLVVDAKGNLYGTTPRGGVDRTPSCDFDGCGAVFLLRAPATKGGAWTEQILHAFTGKAHDGADPAAALLLDAKSGVLYGTTCGGGAKVSGTVFSLTPLAGTAKWAFATLYNFDDGLHGGCPAAPLMMASGNLYGTTSAGGDTKCMCGTVFELSHGAKGWTENVLHDFRGTSAGDGAFPRMGLVIDHSGNLFGATESGGSNGNGAAFEIPSKAGGFGSELVIHSFDYSTDGDFPAGDRLAIGGTGILYGAAEYGGAHGDGTVFALIKRSTTWSSKLLYSFCTASKCTDGLLPQGGVILDASGNLYGTTYYGGGEGAGAVFRLTP